MNWAVKLSITERVVTVAERTPRYSAGPEQRRRCAVVIDRDPEVVSGLSALLMPQLDVQSAVSPLSAAMLLDQLEHVDLAFVELELPDLAGEQLLQQLGRWPDAIRVLLTQKSMADAGLPVTAAPNGSLPTPAVRGRSPLQPSPLQPSRRRPSLLAELALPRNAYLAHLVLSKPISAPVVRALQRATLGLLRI